MDLQRFSKYTEKIKAMLPFWFSMKKKPNESVGLSFLHIFGLELDDIEKILTYAQRQYYIDTADIHMQDIVYKANLPAGCSIDKIQGVYSGEDALIEVKTLYEFYLIEDRIKELHHNLNQLNIYFLDPNNKVIFVRKPYNATYSNPNGHITVNYDGDMVEISMSMHHVWNFFDEFGAIVGCKRLYGESNLSYKYRILDVFRHPANSTLTGLANGIARELNIREHKIWSNTTEDFIINDNMVIIDTILVNGLPPNNIYINADERIVLLGDKLNPSESCEVTYIRSLNIAPLNACHYNNEVSNELFKSDGTPTTTMLEYIEQIKSESSILWNDFIYNDAMWIKDSEEYYGNHFAFVPYRLDANIGGFAKYGFV